MADTKDKINVNQSRIIQPVPIEPLKNVSLDADLLEHNYLEDSDFDEAFKNLLRPIEIISKNKNTEPLQYELLKELDSYLNHLRDSSDNGSSVFVEAALMIQNVQNIYHKRVDRFIEMMTKLVQKFRDYRRKDENDDEVENQEGNKKKKKEKRIKFYATLEPIVKFQTIGTSKIFDCKLIDLRKKPPLRKLVLNANVKVENQYNKRLPYIQIGNGENNGKKYDFMINIPLNRNLAVNEEFDCLTNDNWKYDVTLNYQKSLLPVDMMEVNDEVEHDDSLPLTPNPVNFDQTLNGDLCAFHTEIQTNPLLQENLLNTSKVPPQVDDDEWALIKNVNDDLPLDKPIVPKKIRKLEVQDNCIWLPTYTIPVLLTQLFKLKSSIPVDPAFRHFIKKVQLHQNAIINKNNKNKRTIDEEELRRKHFDAEIDNRLITGEEPGFKGFNSPLHDNFMDFEDDPVVSEPEHREDNYVTYVENEKNMEQHEDKKKEITLEQLAMIKRIQDWHANLRPILEEEEKKHVFDIHEYGTRILNCFKSVGEQIPFKYLVAGLKKEEVSRYYLSTLMMTNTYNLKLIDSDDGKIIELLKRERHHEELQVNIGNQLNH